jgi:GntR family transcriptional repressor for pyruvate dehydrogenase complex
MAKGLLTSHTGHGTFVRNLESSDVASSISLLIALQEDMPARAEHLIEIRRALEVQTSRLAAERATESDINALEKHLLELQKLSDSPEEYAKKDLEFHFLLARATHNPFFEMILSPLMEALLEVIRVALKSEDAVVESMYFHNRITEMIKNHDVIGAGCEMANHLSQTQQAVMNAFEKMRQEEKRSLENIES